MPHYKIGKRLAIKVERSDAPPLPQHMIDDAAPDALSAADSYQQAGDWTQAITHYRRALQISPMPPAFQRYVIYNNLGWCLHDSDPAAGEDEAASEAP